MLDFLMISTRYPKKEVIEIYPKFIIKRSNDLMIRGRDFYAIWDEEAGKWSTDEQDALRLIDKEIDIFAEKFKEENPGDSRVKVLHMWDSETRMIEKWHRYCQKDMRDSYHMLDEKLIFSNMNMKKRDYASKSLSYPLSPCETPAYEELMSTLYSEEERRKIEWAIGSIVSGDSKKIQKFLVLYGAAGTGKSTVLNIIQQLFDGYYSVFDAKALGSSNNSFALEAFKSNPLVAIQHDGDLSRIEDNTRLNSLVSHELMIVNEKFKSTYSNRFKCFLFMGTNKPVKITDGRSGLIRRLIDVSPSGIKIPQRKYNKLIEQIPFELGGIADHCHKVYLENPSYYDDYIPTKMLGASNDFYNFVEDSFFIFRKEDGVSLKIAYEMYKTYCDDAKVLYPLSRRAFQEELKNYFWEYLERVTNENGSRIRSYYKGFRSEKFDSSELKKDISIEERSKFVFAEGNSIFDEECKDFLAQYASEKETPIKKWDNVKTKLSNLDTKKLHYVKLPENHIVIDFDIPGEDGKKSFEENLKAANKWPLTYAELSKSGEGIHLHYIYDGDVSKLNRLYDDHIEIKIFSGKSSLRRKLTKCNQEPITVINSGLPLKGEKKMVNLETIKSEKALRVMIAKNLNKKIHPNTKPSMDFIKKILDDAYSSGLEYDISNMRSAIFSFAASSTNNAQYCMNLVNQLHFKSEDKEKSIDISSIEIAENSPILFYDVEVFPNLFIVCYKAEGEGKTITKLINPSQEQIAELIQYKLVGFNCRKYDNHILYAALLGYSNEELFQLSKGIINDKKSASFFGSAYSISYTDIYDFIVDKKSLKKYEIELGIHHQELGLPWDEPVEEKLWPKVAEYCANDVIATEAVFHAKQSDFLARQILADVAGMTVNDTTNSLTTKIIFGSNKTPQSEFNYRDLGKPVLDIPLDEYKFLKSEFPEMMDAWDSSKLPYFPGYEFKNGKSLYRGEEVGEGGYVYAEPGMYGNVALLDIASMHPTSAITELVFGLKYTKIFKEIKDARVYIKHGDIESAKQVLGGKLTPYLENGLYSLKDLAQALKIAINSVYGLTSATFSNAFRDPRNKDNIVAKRGALFMINLKHEVQKRGYIVAHIKTDSIKIPDADPEIIQFVIDYGKKYGYSFEHEATYEKMCLVNDAVYIARYNDENRTWTATGTQFQVPYVFKKLFSKEDICFTDLCETKSVKSSLYLDLNEGYPDVSEYEKEREKIIKKLTSKENLPVDESVELEKRLIDILLIIDSGHNYHFIGRVGQFCPIKDGFGGGVLVRDQNGKYYAVTGTKGYRWLESEMVRELHKEDAIDISYYENLANEAIEAISKHGDFEWFVSDEFYISPPFTGGRMFDS